jgi:hypothetical protein
MTEEEIELRKARLRRCNLLLWAIADEGRQFFRHGEKVAKLEMDARYRIWYCNEYSGKRVYTHRPYLGRGFHHGGTLHDLICAMRDYIMTGEDRVSRQLGPWPKWICDGDLWGYGEGMQHVRDAWQPQTLTS